MSEHLGYDRHDPSGAMGELAQRDPNEDGADRDRAVATARGPTTGEVAAHFDKFYGAKVFRPRRSEMT